MFECQLNLLCFVQAPQVFDKSRDTCALFGEFLVIYSCRTASLTLFRLTISPAPPTPGDYLPWSKCAMPASPTDAPIPVLDAAHARLKHRPDSNCNISEDLLPKCNAGDAEGLGRANSNQRDADTSTFYQNSVRTADTRAGANLTSASSVKLGLDTSRLWRQSDFESAVPALEQATLNWNTCMISCGSGHQLPVSSSCWSAMATDAARNRWRYPPTTCHCVWVTVISIPCNNGQMRALPLATEKEAAFSDGA